MSVQDIEVRKAKKNSNRRRKKRRTAESDSDSSSSSSDSEPEVQVPDEPVEKELSDVELSDTENKVVTERESLDEASKQKLADIPFTTTEFTSRTARDKTVPINLAGVEEKLEGAKMAMRTRLSEQENELKESYLNLMFENFGDEIHKLREAPDFNGRTINILANVLKDGTGMFDNDTLKAILKSEN
ncbi:Ribosome assembly protein 3 [Nakaseomyces bracarensis]|uniref:Ribosome assembly protein 3 n=1 Tax=Nakaseomyces bracarensis TaxID=273131 RepID=A0ABR4NTN4_9SACH